LNSLGDATERALRLDGRTSDQVRNIPLPSARQLTTEIRAYLFERAKTMQVENKIFGQRRTDKDRNGDHLIVLGPTTDKGLTAEHFVFDSGSRLSFSITVREEGKKSLLLAYRFHYQLPDGAMPAFLRFDLINRAHERASMSRAATCLLGLTKFGFQCPLSRPLRSLTGSSSLSSRRSERSSSALPGFTTQSQFIRLKIYGYRKTGPDLWASPIVMVFTLPRKEACGHTPARSPMVTFPITSAVSSMWAEAAS